MHRYRILYHKQAEIKYTSNLDLYKVWERSCRRAKVPLVYSQGFHPQPKINLACPLPLGITSLAELVDIWLQEWHEPDALKASLNKAVPPGISVKQIDEVSISEPAIQTTIQSARYQVNYHAEIDFNELRARVESMLAKNEIVRQRRNKQYDLRPLVLELRINLTGNESAVIEMLLSASEGKTARPDEVMLELGLDPTLSDITRVQLNRNQS